MSAQRLYRVELFSHGLGIRTEAVTARNKRQAERKAVENFRRLTDAGLDVEVGAEAVPAKEATR
jgi:hypothetical protein